jgi:hypothetical protein
MVYVANREGPDDSDLREFPERDDYRRRTIFRSFHVKPWLLSPLCRPRSLIP